METIQEYRIGKETGFTSDKTFDNRAALKALGMTWHPKPEAFWSTFDEATYQRGVAVCEGRLAYTLSERKEDGSFDVAFDEVAFAAVGLGQGYVPAPVTITPDEALDMTPVNCTQVDLLAAWAHLNGGTIGFDPFRKDGFKTKGEQQAFVLDKWGKAALLAALDTVRERDGKAPSTPKAPKEKAPVTTPAPAPAPGEVREGVIEGLSEEEAALLDIIRNRKGKLDEARVRELAREELSSGVDRFREAIDKAVKDAIGKPNIVAVSTNGVTGPTIKNAHKQFKMAARYMATGMNVLLVGPAGTGKSTIARHYAKAREQEILVLSCSGGMTEATFGVRLLPGKGGDFLPYDSAFVRAYMNGWIIVLDEFDAADPNVMLVLNGALNDDGFFCEARGVGSDGEEYARRIWVQKHEKTQIMACANTYGTGPSMVYQGRNAMDAASMDRWLMLEIGYDEAIDRAYIVDDQTRNIVEWILSVRAAVISKSMKRVISHRATAKAIALAAQGFSLREVKDTLLLGWSPDERAQVGE